MATYRPDHYYLFDEMSAWLQEVVAEHPDWASIASIGKSGEGRDIWVVTLGDRSGVGPDERPAYWIDANTHASEVMGTCASMWTIDHVLANLDDPAIADLLRTTTLYVAPRVNPDGAEYCLTTNHYVRSVRRPYPDPEAYPGLIHEDIDGDGFVLQMRKEAPDGAWRVSEADPRLMTPRMPWHDEGPFYHLWAEGTFEPEALQQARLPTLGRDPHGLDFNRNYPYRWKPEAQQIGAGPYPLSEPETRAIVDFLLAHPNIFGITSYHTFSGVILRPFSDRPDTDMPKLDLDVFKRIGDRCTELTGYAHLSVFHDFRYDPVDTITGAFDDWAYDSLGVHAFTMELWDPQTKAGLDERKNVLDYWSQPTEDDQLRYLKWNDEQLDGEGFVEWRAFDHPQLGRVDLGGWKFLFTFRNAPPKYLEEACRNAGVFTLDHARCRPLPELQLDATSVGADVTRLTAICRNQGYLPTYVTEHARKSKIARDLHLEIELSEGLSLERGLARQRVEHLTGQANVTAAGFSSRWAVGHTHTQLSEHDWILRGTGVATVTWRGDRIGKLTSRVEI